MAGAMDGSICDSSRLLGLKTICSPQLIEAAIGEQLQTRYCKRIDNHQLIWLIVGLGLYARKSYRQIFRLFHAAGTTVASRATLTSARKRLAASALESLADAVITLLGRSPSKHSFAYYQQFKLLGIDGTLLNCPDTDANRKAFGRSSNQTSHGAFPKVRVLSLCELGTRVLWRSIIGSYHESEQKLALKLMQHLGSGMLLLADRHFGVSTIIYPLLQQKSQFLIRVKKSQVFPVLQLLSDGSYISRMYRHKNDRRAGRPGVLVRVIRYAHCDPNRPGCGETHVLLTSLLNEAKYPATELIELYHMRWEEEIAFSEWKVLMCQREVLRSESPEMLRQEIWGMLISHFVIRTLVFRGAQEAGVTPRDISFTGTMDILHARLPEGKKSRRASRKWIANLITEISQERLPPRVDRINPRKIKKRTQARPTKRDCDRHPPPPMGPFTDFVTISI